MQQNDASAAIAAQQRALRRRLPFDDRRDFDAADRGFLGGYEAGVVAGDDGSPVWDTDEFAFISGDSPDTVNPSLWRQSTLAAKSGLYKVVDDIYQVRGLDLSNATFVEGDTGVVVIDPLISSETAAAALELYRTHRGDRPVTGVIFTHSHIDHFGGVLGIVSKAEAAERNVPIVAPEGLVGHAVEENVYAGVAMGRRAGYMYGAALDRGPKGAVGAGLGQSTSTGHPGILAPTIEVTRSGETHTIDGVEIEFQLTPGTEAPSEMNFYLPRHRALCMAENATHTLHNLLTLRGAVVRDPHVWSRYLTEALEAFGERTDVVFASHHWPTWGADEIHEFIGTQRDLYGYLHDQTLRMMNAGLTGEEIAEEITLPPALEHAWNARGYYGSVSHNVKAIYQRYMGWFDGNPARLWPHPPKARAERYVGAIGGVDRVVELARQAYDGADYRWAATLLDHAVFTDSEHAAARALYADTLEQLAYGAENGTWRNFFLSGATELRGENFGTPTTTNAPEIVAQLSVPQIFDSIAIAIDGPNAWHLDLALDVAITNLDESYRVTLRNGVLVYVERAADPESAHASLTTTKMRMIALLGGDRDSAGLDVSGDESVLDTLLGATVPGDPSFNIVVP